MIDVKFPADLRDVLKRLADGHVGTWAHVADIVLAERSAGKQSTYFNGWIDTTQPITHIFSWRRNAD